MKKTKNKKTWKIWLCSVSVVLALAVLGGVWYVSDYYHADTGAIEAFMTESEVKKTMLDKGVLAYGSREEQVGFLFYPGGKVEYTAYEPLMKQLASEGVLCVLLKMPLNLAVLDWNAAEGICDYYPEVERWYIGGHSLGGSMAAYYAEENSEELAGVILLGSYSTKDLSDNGMPVLSIFGSEDRVMNRSKYEENKANLPADFTEVEISGGCHAYFGMYGEQDGDGTPSLTPQEQIAKTAELIKEFMSR